MLDPTKEMMQPCPLYPHVISFVGQVPTQRGRAERCGQGGARACSLVGDTFRDRHSRYPAGLGADDVASGASSIAVVEDELRDLGGLAASGLTAAHERPSLLRHCEWA